MGYSSKSWLKDWTQLVSQPITSSNAEALEEEYEDENKATSKFGLPVGQELISCIAERKCCTANHLGVNQMGTLSLEGLA